MPETTAEHVFAVMVEDVYRDLKTPDLTEAILRSLDETPADSAEPPAEVMPRSMGRLVRIGAALAVAAVLVLTVLLVLNSDVESPPAEVIAGPQAVLEMSGGAAHLKRGWAAAMDHDGELTVANHKLHGGRYVVVLGDIPDQKSRVAMATWLARSHPITNKELEMLKNTKQWLKRGVVALCILGGTVYLDGQPVNAEDDARAEPSPEMAMEAQGQFSVTDVETARKVPANAANINVSDTDNADEVLAALSHLRVVEILIMQKPRGFSMKGAEHIAALTSLKTVGFYETTGVDDAGLEAMKTLSNLDDLQITGAPKLTGTGFSALAALPITQLSVEGCDAFNDDGVAAIAELSQLVKLSFVRVKGITAAGFEALQNTPIESLQVRICPQVGVPEVKAIAGMTLVNSLALGGCTGVTNDAIAELAAMPALESLGIWLTGIGPGIVDALKLLPKLDFVSLGHNSIVEADVIAFGELTTLTGLSITNSDAVTDKSLGALRSLENLRSLNVSHNDQLTDSAVMKLADWKNLYWLRITDAKNVTEAAFDYMEKTNKRLTIYHD